DFLCICSDETVTSQGDEMVFTTAELIQFLGIDQKRVTTDSEVIRSFLERSQTRLQFVFCTYHSSNVLSASLPDGFRFDFGIMDEAHRTAGTNTEFSGPLSDNHTPIVKRVFMTATPKHFKVGKKNSDGDLQLAYSMDDEKVYGRTAYHLPIRKAINLGIIADYEILVSVIDDLSATRAVHTDKLSKHEAVAHAIAIKNAMIEYGLNKVVTFHNTVSEARFFAENDTIKAELGIPLFHVSGQQNMGERTAIMAAFEKANQSLVTNSKCLTEGIDVPEIDLIAFLHPKKSPIDIIQAIGRALRKPRGSDKQKGYILLPLYVTEPTVEGLEKALKEYGYDTIFEVVQALREQDQSVDAAIREAGVDKVKLNTNIFGFPFITPTWNNNRVDVLRNLITTKVIDEFTVTWDINYQLLKEFHESTSTSIIPNNYIYKGVNLDVWAVRQRQLKKTNRLPRDRIDLLDAIGFTWDPLDEKWERAYLLLKSVYETTGTSDIAQNYICQDFKLGKWAGRQRAVWKENQLAQDRIDLLDAIGFTWDPLDEQWERAYLLLKEIYESTGSSNIPTNYIYQEFNLGKWANVTQRGAKKNNRLSQDRIALLEAIGFTWDPLDEQWERAYLLLKEIYDSTGNSYISDRFTYKDFNLGLWCRTQRTAWKKNQLAQDRIALLDAIGFTWDVLDAKWERAYLLLKSVYETTGTTDISQNYICQDFKLGKWVSTQRVTWKHNRLSQNRIALLDAIGFTWDLLDEQWNQYFQYLKEVYETTGNSNISESFTYKDFNLGLWCRTQRKSRKSNKLNQDRINRLDSIG
ncbi:MAG TPA: Helicase associated domain protein, partial [Dyadobacter sp.]|nr:Helicase associated domain protein [Dyadobacter sp.]